MAISSRGEGGVGGGGRGMSGGGMMGKIKSTVTKKKAPAKPLAEPKSAVKVVPAMPKGMRKAQNDYATAQAERLKSGKAAKSADSAREQSIAAQKKQAAAKAAGKQPKPVKRAVQKSEMYGVRVLKKK